MISFFSINTERTNPVVPVLVVITLDAIGTQVWDVVAEDDGPPLKFPSLKAMTVAPPWMRIAFFADAPDECCLRRFFDFRDLLAAVSPKLERDDVTLFLLDRQESV